MADVYSAHRLTADRLLKKFGQAMVLSRKTVGIYDPQTSTAVVVAVSHAGFGVSLDVTEREIDGTKVLRGDKRVFMPVLASGAEPAVDDQLTYGGKTYTIKASEPVAPSGAAVMHQLRVRA